MRYVEGRSACSTAGKILNNSDSTNQAAALFASGLNATQGPEWCRASCCMHKTCGAWTFTDPIPGSTAWVRPSEHVISVREACCPNARSLAVSGAERLLVQRLLAQRTGGDNVSVRLRRRPLLVWGRATRRMASERRHSLSFLPHASPPPSDGAHHPRGTMTRLGSSCRRRWAVSRLELCGVAATALPAMSQGSRAA